MSRYGVTFSIDGTLTVDASSPEEAERLAVDAVEDAQLWGADDVTVDCCTVKVGLEFTYNDDDTPDKCNKVERPAKAVEFTS